MELNQSMQCRDVGFHPPTQIVGPALWVRSVHHRWLIQVVAGVSSVSCLTTY
uniref:Uncharacterized protein n=1 Tax=Picea glauca TaxID=3330 RepID=A0A117NFJ8_PICGL|nr:hypothetical protein ABT39_MTgene3465 [Picea glauca]